jgi:hypothetical protein
MDWKKQFRTDESELKALIDKLAQAPAGGPLADLDRAVTVRSLARKLVEMRAFADDRLEGQNEEEKSILEYKLRLEFPLFAHLSSLSMISREYVEWSCA